MGSGNSRNGRRCQGGTLEQDSLFWQVKAIAVTSNTVQTQLLLFFSSLSNCSLARYSNPL
ncbi:MAG: hypothetical protein AAGE92_07815 [Cyanobacteria bacterium P01_G01_bin.4]